MDKIKKIWKELSVFGIIIVVFLGLFFYKKLAFAEISTISEEKLADKIKDKDSFVVVVGNDTDNNTLGYKETMKKFVNNNRGDSLYYVDLSTNKSSIDFIKKTFATDDGSVPQTFVIKNGEVVIKQSGLLSYYRLDQLYN